VKKLQKMLRQLLQAVAQATRAFPIIFWSAVKPRVPVERLLVQLRLPIKQQLLLRHPSVVAYLLALVLADTLSVCSQSSSLAPFKK
jgi:hypothetical protein